MYIWLVTLVDDVRRWFGGTYSWYRYDVALCQGGFKRSLSLYCDQKRTSRGCLNWIENVARVDLKFISDVLTGDESHEFTVKLMSHEL